ncbi:Potassium/sodium hyperpolarization-activated cyclic nucleotide-gated channel 2 [Atta colombica]|uniref:Potassium/sodium hyperpolarization-activated cyclic nucleotide-gated channel 2 n=1 Tax=Atta colombica TaxID=520822 RepID=A0A195BGT2_9HYME|nr:Potassium/sodium hyperpolarization-activated cyclic nucleotide-gated channel 2 [Atta colombica]
MVVSAANYITGNLLWPRRVYARDARREHARANVKLSTFKLKFKPKKIKILKMQTFLGYPNDLNNNILTDDYSVSSCLQKAFSLLDNLYFDKAHYTVVMEPKKIMKKYIRHGTFLPDLLGSLPTDIIFIKTWQENIVTRELWQSCFYWILPIAMTSMYLPKQPSEDYWINEFNLWEESASSQYLHSLLRSISIFLSAGFTHKKPKTSADLSLVILFQIVGTSVIWNIIARVNQLYKGANSSKIKYQNIIAEVKQYMKRRQLPYLTQCRIINYYEFCFKHQYFCEREILNTLSSYMRQEIGMHTCRKLVENVTFFNNLPLLLITRIVDILKSEIFLPNDIIVRVNESGDCMYFIASGTVAIYTSTGKEVCHLEDGAHFGEIALVMVNERRVASVVAVEICELYRLDRADFARTIHPYPMLWEQIKKIAIERHERTTILNIQ